MGRVKNIIHAFKTLLEISGETITKDYSLTDSEGFKAAFPQLFGSNDPLKSITWACISARAEAMQNSMPAIYEYVKGKKEEITNENDVVLSLFKKPNAFNQVFSDLAYLTSMSLDINGKAFFYFPKNFLNVPQQFIFLPPTTEIKLTADKTDVSHYEARIDGKVYSYAKDEVIYFYLPHPSGVPFKCRSTMEAIRQQVNIDNLQAEFNENYLKNNARIDGYLYNENGLSKEQKEDLKTQWKTKYSGSKNAGKTPVLTDGTKYQELQSTLREMDFVKSKASIQEEIRKIFRVPPLILGEVKEVNRASAVIAKRVFLQDTMIPFSRFIENKLNIFIKNAFRDTLEFKFLFDIAEDPDITLKQNDLLAKYGVITGNELRGQYNWGESDNPEMNEFLNQGKETQTNENQNN